MAELQMWEISNGGQADPVVFFGRTENFNYFVQTSVEDESTTLGLGQTRQSKKVKEHSRRRFPGDSSPINVSEQPEGRQYLHKLGKTSGAARPGKTIIFKDMPGVDPRETAQFQYTGDWKEVIKYLESDSSKQFRVIHWNGSKVTIPDASEAADG